MEKVDNIMVTDWWWDEQEYRVPSKARLKREMQAYEDAEREGFGNGNCNSGDYAGERKNFL